MRSTTAFRKKNPLQSAAALFPVQFEKEVRLFMRECVKGECVNSVYDTFVKDDKFKNTGSLVDPECKAYR